MDKTFDEAVAGIRKAERGVEVREDIAQGMEYVKQYAEEVTGQQQAALQAAKTATGAASTATKKAAAAAKSEAAANTAATSADQSAQAASENAGKAESSAAAAKESAKKAAAVVSTDKTLTIEGAPADAKATGDALNARYTKEKTDELLKNVNPFPVGSIYQTVSFASPALTFGGTWSELDAGTAELPVKNMHIWERMGYLLNVRAIAESSLTITDGETTIEDTVDASGRYARELPSTGTWTVTATVGSDVRTQTCAVDKYGVYTVELDWKIFGVVWDYGKPSTALTRLTKASDPHHFVTTDITTEPVAAVGATGGRSPFDNYMPWSGMEEYNIAYGFVGAKRGSSGFSRSNDTMVLIPEFYYKVVDDAASKRRYFYISDKASSGFDKHPGSDRYVGRYKTGTGYVSKTGITALQKLTRAAARTGSTAKGSGWYQFDYAAYCAIILLYIVEYADWDSQTKIGQGIVSNTSASVDSGKTDSMTYHTGRASGTDGYTAVQYRHIEDLWGTICTFVDGINFNGGTVYICTDSSKYADDTATGYTKIGTRATSTGYIKTLGFSAAAPWAIYPSEVGGSETTYVPDYLWADVSNWSFPLTGGHTNSGTKAGMFYMDCFYSSRAELYSGSRLMYIPQN